MVNDFLAKLTSRELPPNFLLIAYISIVQGGMGLMDAHSILVPKIVLTMSQTNWYAEEGFSFSRKTQLTNSPPLYVGFSTRAKMIPQTSSALSISCSQRWCSLVHTFSAQTRWPFSLGMGPLKAQRTASSTQPVSVGGTRLKPSPALLSKHY